MLIMSLGNPRGELNYFGDGDIAASADLDAVAELGVKLNRFKHPGDFLGGLLAPSTVFFTITHTMRPSELRLVVHAAVVRSLVRLGVDRRLLSSEGNDVYVEHEGVPKKVFGDFTVRGEQFATSGGFTTFDFDLDGARRVFDLSTEKFKKKGGVKDIGAIVCGIRDVHTSAEPAVFRDTIANLIAERLDVELVPGDFTERERRALDSVYAKIHAREWLKHGRWQEDD